MILYISQILESKVRRFSDKCRFASKGQYNNTWFREVDLERELVLVLWNII